MARSVDRHGQKSNPTAIYEFEMVRDGPQGGFIPVFKRFDQPENNLVDEKMIKKYLSVKPSDSMKEKIFESLVFDEQGDLKIDDKSDTFVNKKFKMRLTSKNTGRKLDLNVAYKLKNKGFITDYRELQDILQGNNLYGDVDLSPHGDEPEGD